MHTICIASGKGGNSKTTLTAAFGVWLAAKRHKVTIVDLNFGQATLTNWWGKRGRPANPHLLKITNFQADMARLRHEGVAYCLIDTPPDDVDLIHTGILEADATLICVRPSELDIEACRTVVDLCRRRRKPAAFLLAQVLTGQGYKSISNAAVAQLGEIASQVPVLEAVFPMNKAYVASLADPALRGKVGHEIDKALEKNIAAIWKEVEAIGGRT